MNNKFFKDLKALIGGYTERSKNSDFYYGSLYDFMFEQAHVIKDDLTANDKKLRELNEIAKDKDNFWGEIYFSLDKDTLKKFDEYMTAVHDCFSHKIFHFYMSGYVDCFKMLSFIGVFNDFKDYNE